MSATPGSFSSEEWKHDLLSPFSRLLNNNVVLPPHSQPALDDFILQGERHLEMLQQSMHRLRDLLSKQKRHHEELEGFIHRHRELTRLRPIATFPAELLLQVFHHLPARPHYETWPYSGYHDLNSLRNPVWAASQVCQHWRLVVRGTPQLWSSLELSPWSVDVFGPTERHQEKEKIIGTLAQIQVHLLLSKTTPLSIKIVLACNTGTNSTGRMYPSRVSPLLQILRRSRARWRHLSIAIGNLWKLLPQIEIQDSPETLATPMFPNLQSMEYKVVSNNTEVEFELSTFSPQHYPRLNELRLFGVRTGDLLEGTSVLGTMTPWAQLKVISVSNCDLDWIHDVLHEMSSLQTLSLKVMNEPSQSIMERHGSHDPYVSDLPSLHTLELSYPTRIEIACYKDAFASAATDSDTHSNASFEGIYPVQPQPHVPKWMYQLNAPLLRRLSVGCLSINRNAAVVAPFVGFAEFLESIGETLTEFYCTEFCCTSTDQAFPTLVTLMKSMPSLRSLDLTIGHDVWDGMIYSHDQDSKHFTILTQVLKLRDEEGRPKLLPDLERLALGLSLDGRPDRDSLLSEFMDALEDRFDSGSLRRVEVVLKTTPGVKSFVPSVALRIGELAQVGVVVQLKQITQELEVRRTTRKRRKAATSDDSDDDSECTGESEVVDSDEEDPETDNQGRSSDSDPEMELAFNF